jgi:hypothetical protein
MYWLGSISMARSDASSERPKKPSRYHDQPRFVQYRSLSGANSTATARVCAAVSASSRAKAMNERRSNG